MTTETNQTQNHNTSTPSKAKISNSTIINTVLFIGLIVLYALYFFKLDHNVGSSSGEPKTIAERIAEGSFNIAYIQTEKLMERYDMAIQMRADFEAEQKRMEGDLSRRQSSFQTELERFQRQVQQNAITIENAQRKEQELMQMRDNLMQMNETYGQNLMLKEREMNFDLYESISEFLKRYNEKAGHDYILGYSQGGGILYASEALDITETVVNMLNEEYKAKITTEKK